MINLRGQKFGRLTVIKPANKSTKQGVIWVCQCICGSNLEVNSKLLRSGSTQSCGCLYQDTRKKGGQLLKGRRYVSLELQRMYSYKKNARDRHLIFDLTNEQCASLFNANCVYCGNISPNGIDRIDNSLGYTIENCQPCCKICNYAKSNRSEAEFLAWVERIWRYQNA